MSSTTSAKSWESAPGCCSKDACSASFGDFSSRAKENGGGISSPLTTRASVGLSAEAEAAAALAASSLRRCPERPRPRSIRPGYKADSVPNASTTASGVWWPIWTAPEPTRILEVADAIAPISTAGEDDATPSVR